MSSDAMSEDPAVLIWRGIFDRIKNLMTSESEETAE